MDSNKFQQKILGSPLRFHSNKRKQRPDQAGPPDQASRKKRKMDSPKSSKLQTQRSQLPIAQGRDALVEIIRNNEVTILIGETGSGKTTQVPQYVYEAGLAGSGLIAVTQPRRVATTSLASRVASEQSVSVGGLVGYAVRFDERSGPDTKIKYLTDGMLMRELLSDSMLTRYSVIIIDEAHERTLRTDLLISSLKAILQKRNRVKQQNPLKVIVMSATLDADKFSKFYNDAKVVYVKGRQHPVQVFHTATGQSDYLDAALRTFFQIHIDNKAGDVLIFLPGQEDIESLDKSIMLYASQLPKNALTVTTCPMFSALPPGQQAKIFAQTPANSRKCILATNIAETSITVPGIKFVIDTGKCKEKRYVARQTGSGLETLLTRDISKSSAMQRAGRAGREGEGYCFRLYTEESFNSMVLSYEPEIRRCNLAASLLQLKCQDVDLDELEFMDQPDHEAVRSALTTLSILGAIDKQKKLTKLGRDMAFLPIEPRLSRVILASKEFGCALEILDIVSILSASSSLFVDVVDHRDDASEARVKFRHPSGDHLTVLNVVRAYQDVSDSENKSGRKAWCRKQFINERTLLEAIDIRNQLRETCTRIGIDWKVSCRDDEQPVLRSFVCGLVQNTAFLQPDGTYRQMMGPSTVKIHPGSVLCDKKFPAILYNELVFTSQTYARGVSAISKTSIMENLSRVAA